MTGPREEQAGPDPQTGPDPELIEDLGPELEFRGDQLDAELEAARSEAAQCRDTAQRALAELDNYRKRIQRDQADAVARAGERIISELLPSLDNLERAIDHTTAGGDLRHLLDGVEAVQRQVLDVFAKEGAVPIDPFGQQFDPNCHQAVGQVEDAEVPEGTVVEVYQRGYEMHGRILRPAMVIVSTGGPPAPKE
ncbi:MAG: nucleotide exchange factor GrpE [Coriobacteriales bacterium]|nr:nucleotide exchange factor GrpE [Coriobacteriales bacterium]